MTSNALQSALTALAMMIGVMCSAASAHAGQITIVRPANDSTITLPTVAQYVFNDGGQKPQFATAYIRFSTAPEVGSNGLLSKRDLGSLDAYAGNTDPFSDAPVERTPSFSEVPRDPGVVYWQPYFEHHTGGASGLIVGPVAKVTILNAAPVVTAPTTPSIGTPVDNFPPPYKAPFHMEIERHGLSSFSVDEENPVLFVHCSLACTASARSEVTIKRKRRIRHADLDLVWTPAKIPANPDSSKFEDRNPGGANLQRSLTSRERKKLLAAMGKTGVALLKTTVTAVDVDGRTETDEIVLELDRDLAPQPKGKSPSSSSSKPKTLTEKAEAATEAALDKRHMENWFVRACDKIGPSSFDCTVASSQGGTAKHATVRRTNGKWYVGRFRDE